MFRSLLIARAFIALLLSSVTLAVGDQPPPQPARALPLHKVPIGLATADERGFYRMATAVGDDYFDGTSDEARVRRHFETARRAGVQYLRCAFSWNAIEHERGLYDWRFWDMLVRRSEEYGIGLMPYVAYPPEWAVANSKDFWKQPPRDSRDYADFMRTIAGRYKGRIRSWELWNEPDLTEYWQGSAAQFAGMVKQAAVAVRDGDPDAVIVLGGISRAHDPLLRELITKYHVDRYVDVVAIHGYPESWLPERMETVFGAWVEEVSYMLKTSGSGVDLWLNEMGYPDWRYAPAKASIYGSPVYFGYEHTREYAAEALFKAEVLALSSGSVSLTGWYRIDDFCNADFSSDAVNYHLGLVDCETRSKPALTALTYFDRVLAQPVRKATVLYSSSAHPSQAVVEAFERKDRHVIVAAWLRSPRADEAKGLDGNAIDERRETLRLTLPCTPQKVVTTDVTGALRPADRKLAANRVSGLEARGDRVAVLDVTCVTPARDGIPLTADAPSGTLISR